MKAMNINRLREQLKIDEGVKYEIYLDHLGYPTFGIGHLVTQHDEEHGKPVGTPITEERVNSVFDSDVETYISEAKKVFPDLDNLPEDAQEVIVNMTFNMGAPRLSKFKKFIAAVEAHNWNTASVEMMDSRWAKQVGNRAIRLRDRIKALGS
jgi:lysozyme